MKTVLTAVCSAALLSTVAGAATVGVDDSSAPWLGFMNVFELDGTSFIFGSSWGIADLNASFDDGAGTLTMSPNTIGDPDPFWYIGGGGPGAQGNKIMEANLYQQVDDDSLAGQTVTFEGVVLSNTFTAAHEARLFIRDFAPDYSSVNEVFIDAVDGAFSFSLLTDAGLGRHVQWGLQVKGENVWFTDTAPFGSVTLGTIPAPGSLALLGLGGLVATRRRR
ncbi:MAG: PEP-CTERM sorting domain-containing protein [Phycisphaerales bacterium]|nr:PEP-CTERM sorting domain-containing protein [Phycisphaerales bacterium]